MKNTRNTAPTGGGVFMTGLSSASQRHAMKRPIEHDQRTGHQQPPAVGAGGRAGDGSGVVAPEKVRGEPYGDGQPHGAAAEQASHRVAGRVSKCCSGLCLTR